ncbi:hypothetical protein GCM10027612_43580 [Microbispora bryophytorum subsp. camponoti]
MLTTPRHDYTRALLAAVPSASAAPRRPDRSPGAAPRGPVLAAMGLSVAYGSRRAVDDVSFRLHAGETLGVVGESGSGKTTLARLALGLLAPDAGEVILRGGPWSGLPERRRRPLRPAVQVIAQNPLDSFDPRHTVGRLVADPLSALPRRRRRSAPSNCWAGSGCRPNCSAGVRANCRAASGSAWPSPARSRPGPRC